MSDLLKKKSALHCLMLVTRDPYNNHTGRGLVLKTAINFLNKLDIRTTIICFDEIALIENTTTYQLGFPSFFDIIKSTIFSFLLRRPVSELLYYNKKKLRLIEQIVNDESPDFVYVDMIRLAKYAKIIGLPTILDLDDLLSLRYREAAKSNHQTGFGYLLKRVPQWINRLFLFFNSQFLARESRLLIAREVHYAKNFSCTSLVSAVEADNFNSAHGTNLISLPMHIPTIKSENLTATENKYNALFVGTLNYDANLQAFQFLAGSVLPLIRAIPGMEDFTLTLIGRAPEDKELYSYAGVQMVGYVENLTDYYISSEVVLAPSFLPGGIKTKVIEALSHGRPTVVNSFALEGLDNIKEITFQANTPEEWVENILKIKSNPIEAAQRAKKGIQYVRDRFGEEKLQRSWGKAVNSLGLRDPDQTPV